MIDFDRTHEKKEWGTPNDGRSLVIEPRDGSRRKHDDDDDVDDGGGCSDLRSFRSGPASAKSSHALPVAMVDPKENSPDVGLGCETGSQSYRTCTVTDELLFPAFIQ